MGLADAFGAEDRVEVKFSDFYNMMKAASDATSEMKYVKNALEAGVPANYIRSMLDGKPYPNDINARTGPYYGQPEEDKHDT